MSALGCVCKHACTACIYVCMHACLRACVHVHVHVHVHVCMYVYMYNAHTHAAARLKEKGCRRPNQGSPGGDD